MAGIAGGRFDDRAAGSQEAVAFGGLDHPQADSVLDRAAGVEHLELGQDERLRVDGAEASSHAGQVHEWRVADQIEDRVGVAHHRKGVGADKAERHRGMLPGWTSANGVPRAGHARSEERQGESLDAGAGGG